MVNTGRPSEACTKCRDRRVKCDAVKPSCGNCLKLGTPCPGYPEPPGIMFRDDTAKTQRRAQRMYRNLQNRADDSSRSEDPEDRPEGSRESSSESSRLDLKSPRRSMSTNPHGTPELGQEPSSSSQIIAGTIEALSKQLDRRGFAAYIDRLYDAVSMYPIASGPLKASVELLALSVFADSNVFGRSQMNSVTQGMRSKVTREMNVALDKLKSGSGNHEQILLAVEVTLLIDCCFNFRDSSAAEVDNGIRMHLEGMCAIVNHAGSALLETELGRNLYINALMFHLHIYSPLSDLPRIPGPENAMEILGQQDPNIVPDYRMLTLLYRSFNLRREAMQLFVHHPMQINLQVILNLKQISEELREDFEGLWARLPAARKFGASGTCRWAVNAHWVHRILIEDLQIRCLSSLRQLQQLPDAYLDEINTSIQKAQFAVRVICQGLPYSFTEADLPSAEEEAPTFQDVLFAWNGHTDSNPLLICSMVDVLSEEQHTGISCARAACARAAGLRYPIMTLPRMLLKVS